MHKLFTLSLFLTFASLLSAQPNQYTKASDSDPEAKAILDKVRKKYDAYRQVAVDFKLEIEFPEQPKETQKGQMARQGDNYHFRLGQQEVLCDGKAIYFILHNNQEVLINDIPDPDEETDILSPESLFTFYDQGKFIYSLLDTYTEGKRVIHAIEFKPTDRSSEYSKIRLVVDRDSKEIVRVKAFSKDGSRYTFMVDQMNFDPSFKDGYFAYNQSRYPGYYVEDLRE